MKLSGPRDFFCGELLKVIITVNSISLTYIVYSGCLFFYCFSLVNCVFQEFILFSQRSSLSLRQLWQSNSEILRSVFHLDSKLLLSQRAGNTDFIWSWIHWRFCYSFHDSINFWLPILWRWIQDFFPSRWTLRSTTSSSQEMK